MTARAKFLFDLDFAAPPGSKGAGPTITAAHEAALAEAEARGYRNGLASAEAQVRTQAERQTAHAFERIGSALADIAGRLVAVESRLEAEAVEVAVAVARKLAPALIAREPFAEVAALATECFRELLSAPHVVVRVHDGLYAFARERLDEVARALGFEGRLVVLGEEAIAPGDCRIEWADGGLVRDRAATEAAVAEAVGRYVAIRRAGAA
jgi:flagellar assembly protein FliH